MTASANRHPTYPIHSIILNRCSSRALSDELMSDQELLPLFEAARWAPSSLNAQPWRFLYAHKGTQEWSTLFSCLLPGNQKWCTRAAVLLVVLSQKEQGTLATFATGAAFENLCLEGTSRGYVVHGMGGFDREKLQKTNLVPEDYHIEIMTAIGKKGKIQDLPEDLQKRELPSTRLPLEDLFLKNG